MQIKNVRKAGRVTACALSAALMFSGMNMDVLAKEASGLPSAGIDYFLSSNATSVKNLKDEEETQETVPVADEETDSEEETDGEEKASVSPTAMASATATATATAAAAIASPVKELLPEKEDKVIEETVEASTTKSLNQMERELETKREEKTFRSLVIAKVNDYVNVRSMPSEEGEILGKLYDKSVGEFISEEDGWYEIESGSVTGYVKAEYCVTGEDAVDLAKKVGTRIATVTTTTLKVREEPGLDAVVLGLIPIDDQLLVTEELDEWVKVNIEEGDGYISKDYVTLSTEFVKAESKAEEEARLAKEAAERKAAQEAAARAERERKAKSSSSSSGQEAPAPVYVTGGGSELGQSVANYACQFVGNPYVYGGTSLTNGADCSGFVMSVYKNFGVSLPHSSAADRSVGAAVNGLENAQPGDIVCYSGHVGIYVGNGQIVHASTSKTGIIVSNANYRSVLSVRRIF
ncbi:NlpC/P60 family protein [Parablautia intestinalis]|uniref:C40 family peptidase n=1 Tax=Parablautia intestinalis TaxID=2320100 RepID=UPI00256EE390|nr:NlpC/P60 family protein [Parablautia intestinalis]